MSRYKEKVLVPTVGMVATRQQYSDRDVWIITAISASGHTVTLKPAKQDVRGTWQVEEDCTEELKARPSARNTSQGGWR